MKLFIKIIFIFSLLLLGLSTTSSAQSVNFAQTSLSNLKKGSKQTNKPYFIYLYNENCADCKQVENLTFTDSTVSDVINSNLLAGKIKQTSKEGQKLMAKNKIALAPAFLFYNQKGKLILQQESALSSAELLKLLRVLYDLDIDISNAKLSTDRFNNFEEFEVSTPAELESENDKNITEVESSVERKIVAPKAQRIINLAPSKVPELSNEILSEAKTNSLKSPDQLFDYSDEEDGITAEVVIQKDSKPESINLVKKASVSEFNQAESKVGNVRLVNSEVVTKTIIHTRENPIVTTELVSAPKKSVSVSRAPASVKKNKSIQFAAYNRYDDVLKGMYKMKRKISEPLTIVEEYTKGKLMYKLVIDNRMTLSQAEAMKSTFQQKDIDCFVRTAPN